MNEDHISFLHEGKRYHLKWAEIYAVNDYTYVKLPNGKVLEVDGWAESFPPQPSFRDVEGDLKSRYVFDAVEA